MAVEHDLTLTQGNFAVVDETSLIFQISPTERAGGSFSAEATFVGSILINPPASSSLHYLRVGP